jgi:hypothetical protein
LCDRIAVIEQVQRKQFRKEVQRVQTIRKCSKTMNTGGVRMAITLKHSNMISRSDSHHPGQEPVIGSYE